MNSIVNLTIPEASTNSTSTFTVLMSITEICVYSLNVLFGLLTHFYVIWLIIGTGNRIASEFFNLNFSVCEIGNCLNCFLYALSVCFSSVHELAYFSKGLVITGRPLFQCLICVERYLAVVHPVTFLKFRPLRYRAICCLAAWFITLSSCVCCMFLLVCCTIDNYMYFSSVQFLLFLSIQLFCCQAVLRALKQSGPGERGREKEEENNMKRKAFNLILISTINIVVIYLPYCISGFIDIFLHLHIPALWFVIYLCYFMAGFVHPIMFLHKEGKLSCLCFL